jgi:hypothetical protein
MQVKIGADESLRKAPVKRRPCARIVHITSMAVASAIMLSLFAAYADAGSSEKLSDVPLASEKSLILGVLEENARSWGYSSGVKTSYSRHLRAVFWKDGDDWKAFPSFIPDQNGLKTIVAKYPQRTIWTIAYHGRQLGQVTGRIEPLWRYYSDVGWQDVISARPIPTIGRRSIEYGGFIEEPVVRPLVAISQPNFKDPEGWKRSTLSVNITQLAHKYFRQKFPKVCNCKNPDENVARPWAYKDKNIAIVAAYRSKDDWHLVEMNLTPYNCDFAIEEESSPFVTQWFIISPSGQVTFLDAGMWLVDAGDYDGKGKSDLLFSIDRYNRGGYELFYDDFKKRATFQFGYH